MILTDSEIIEAIEEYVGELDGDSLAELYSLLFTKKVTFIEKTQTYNIEQIDE